MAAWKFDVSEEAAREGFFDFALSPAQKRRAGRDCADKNVRHRALLVLSRRWEIFFNWACCCLSSRATRPRENALWLREIRSSPFSLSGGVTRGGEDILFLRHGRISCVCLVTHKLVDMRFIADRGTRHQGTAQMPRWWKAGRARTGAGFIRKVSRL